MGMTYEELALYGRLRKQNCCGPYSMFCKLVHVWKDRNTPEEVSFTQDASQNHETVGIYY